MAIKIKVTQNINHINGVITSNIQSQPIVIKYPQDVVIKASLDIGGTIDETISIDTSMKSVSNMVLLGRKGDKGDKGDSGDGSDNWVNLMSLWTESPTQLYSSINGVILAYSHQETTKYRFVPTPYNSYEDAFYEDWDGVELMRLIARRG